MELSYTVEKIYMRLNEYVLSNKKPSTNYTHIYAAVYITLKEIIS